MKVFFLEVVVTFLEAQMGKKVSEGKEKVLRVVVFYTRKKAQLQVKKALPLVAPF